MREIKFRAWLNGKRKMVYNLGFDDRSFTTLDDPTLEEDEMPSVWDKDCIIDDSYYEGAFSFELMQYTGLKDKNGKEIYEGDVHGIGDCTFEVRHGSYTDDMTLEESYGWHVYDERDGTGCNLGESEIWVNIIGNIHENPELLEGR